MTYDLNQGSWFMGLASTIFGFGCRTHRHLDLDKQLEWKLVPSTLRSQDCHPAKTVHPGNII